MPELPEVETIRRSLASSIVGKKIGAVEIRAKKQFIGNPKDITHARIEGLSRWAKILTISLSNGRYIAIHLKMSGEILYARNSKRAVLKNNLPRSNTNTLPNKHTRVILYFADNSALYFNDLRMFGWMKVLPEKEKAKSPDILSPEFTKAHLANVIRKTRKPIKLVLMDQEKMGGIGNIYANDSLWQARIHPARAANSLSEKETETLYKSIKTIIHEGVRYKGSSAADEMYVLPTGEKGQYQNHLKVYHRTGKLCLRRDAGTIQRIALGGRGTFYCPACQLI